MKNTPSPSPSPSPEPAITRLEKFRVRPMSMAETIEHTGNTQMTALLARRARERPAAPEPESEASFQAALAAQRAKESRSLV